MGNRSTVLLLAAIVSAGCGRKTPAANTGGVLTIAVPADVTGIFPNPPFQTESHSFDVNSNIFEGLVRFDRNLIPEPALADRWINEDERTWVFHLRPGARFSNGKPVQARDVESSLNAARKRGWATGVFLESIESVVAIGNENVRIRTTAPSAILLSKLHYGFVVPAEGLESSRVAPVGTGPYRLEAWSPGRELVLKRNIFWRGPAPAFDQIRFRVVANAGDRIRQVLDRRADIADHTPLAADDPLWKDSRVRVHSAPGLRVLFLALRMNAPPFSDSRVREAVGLTIDRTELIRRSLAGNAVATSQLVTQSVSGYNPGLPPARLDRARARSLLAEAGYPKGFAVRLDGPNNRYVADGKILQEVARQLAEVGIRAQVNAIPKDAFFSLLNAGQSSFYLLGWACETRDAGDVLDALIHSPTSSLLGSNNTQGLSDPELDRLIEEADSRSEPSLRNALLARAIARIDRLHAIVPLEIQTETLIASPRLRWTPPINFGLRLFDQTF